MTRASREYREEPPEAALEPYSPDEHRRPPRGPALRDADAGGLTPREKT